jgi:ribosome biogenesis GTPase A
MPIVWYPAHMANARKEAAKTMGKIDLVIEVLDARVPQASCNPVFEELRRQGKRPALKLLNKSALAGALQRATGRRGHRPVREEPVRGHAHPQVLPGAAARSRNGGQAVTPDDPGNSQRRKIDVDERPAQAPPRSRRR